MIKQVVLDVVHKYFPDVQIDYKDQSTFMQVLGKILFFTPSFMTNYTTTIGDTIYYPSSSFVNNHVASTFVILLHEIVHVSDEKTISKTLFSVAYLFPQLLVLLAIPFAFVIGWWALLFLLFGTPLPAYFRMLLERRAYMASIYVMKKLNDKCNYNINLDDQMNYFLAQFKNSSYYWMWPIKNIDTEFANALTEIKNNNRPYNDKVFDILDEIIAAY
jgi:hypothetical protein